MIKPEQVPDEAWRATGLPESASRAVVAAALSAWPGQCTADGVVFPHIILPLPQKRPDVDWREREQADE